MLTVLCGLPGSGKTSYATKLAYKSVLSGKNVFSNYPISFPLKIGKEIFTYSTNILIPDMLSSKSFPENSFIIIDEIQNWFGSRDWKNFNKDTLKFFTGHRHQGIDLLVIAQHPQRVDVTIREIADSFNWIEPFFLRFKKLITYYHSEDVGKVFPYVPENFYKISFIYDSKKYKKYYDTYSLKNTFTEKINIQKYDYFEGRYYTLYEQIKKQREYKNKLYNDIKINNNKINNKKNRLLFKIYTKKINYNKKALYC